jgi:endonuclease G
VAVPTHFYKVVLAENASGGNGGHSAALGAFVMPNAPIDPETPLSAYAVPLGALECVAGGWVGGGLCGRVGGLVLSWQGGADD